MIFEYKEEDIKKMKDEVNKGIEENLKEMFDKVIKNSFYGSESDASYIVYEYNNSTTFGYILNNIGKFYMGIELYLTDYSSTNITFYPNKPKKLIIKIRDEKFEINSKNTKIPNEYNIVGIAHYIKALGLKFD